jgi:3-oxoacyl-[acyl-carrier protein] reductase
MHTTIWITGASRGIGRAIALKIAEKYSYNIEETHLNLVINSRHDDDDLNTLAVALCQKNACVLKLTGDVSSEEDRSSMLERIHDRFGSVDVLINNAGQAHIGLLQDMSPDQIRQLFSANLGSAVALSAMVVPDLLKSTQKPRILNISSVWGNVGASCEAVYSATKGGLNAFTKALAKELAPSRIPVNAIACGLIDTAMNGHLSPEELAALCDEIPAGRAGTPEEVAEVVCALLDATDYLTGQIITLDGGWT